METQKEQHNNIYSIGKEKTIKPKTCRFSKNKIFLKGRIMSLQIIYGRSGSGKTSYIFQQISEDIANGRKKYIITPEQFSFSAEKELLDTIAKNNKSTAVIDAEVLTFARMAHRVARRSWWKYQHCAYKLWKSHANLQYIIK